MKSSNGEVSETIATAYGMLLIPDITRNARAACDSAEVQQSAYRTVSRYVVGMITVNSLIYNILCIISRDFMCHEFRNSSQKISPFANETR